MQHDDLAAALAADLDRGFERLVPERLAGAGYRGPTALDVFLHLSIMHMSP